MVEIVSEHTGASTNDILTGKTEQCVNCRAILVSSLYSIGFNDTSIAQYLNITRQGVNKLRNSLPYRKRHNIILSTTCQQISNYLATEKLISNSN